MFDVRFIRIHWCVALSAGLVTLASMTASAQETTGTNASVVAVTSGADLVTEYVFRGIRQNSTGIAIRPSAAIGLSVYSGDAALKRITINAGFWNSLHTGDTGSAGPTGRIWYESDVYAGVDLAFDRGLSVNAAYTTYMSPNDMFDSVKEVSFRFALDDRLALGKAAFRPYVLGALELDTAMAEGQADGGRNAGTYLEVGAAPGYERRRFMLAFPVKLGLSIGDYYELGGEDHRFGFASVASLATVPLTRGRSGRLRLHGGVEYQVLGETTRIFNGGDRSNTIGSVGVRFSY